MLLSALSLFLVALQTKCLQSDFAMTITANKAQPITYAGNIIMHEDRFRLDMLSIEAAYDGKTLYMYQEDTDELTLSSPEQDELTQVNPFLLAKSIVPLCNVTERTVKEGEETIMTFTPKKQTKDIKFSSLTVQIRTSDQLPLSMEMREAKQTVLLRFADPKWIDTKTIKASSFILEKENAYINDLR